MNKTERLTKDAKIGILKNGRQVVYVSLWVNDSNNQGAALTEYIKGADWLSKMVPSPLAKGILTELRSQPSVIT